MSALAVLLALDHSPLPLEQFRHLLRLQQSSGRDAELQVTADAVGLGIAVLATTPEDHLDPPCLRVPNSGVCVVFDGYLSNRAELASQLLLSTAELNVCGDARLIAHAYERWQLDTWTRLEGEFVIALWDPAVERLVLARDAFGLRPVYYRATTTQFCAATELQALVRTGSSSLNEGVIGEALLGRPSTLDETLFAEIKRLPPAHALVVDSAGTMQLHHYWTLDLTRTIELADDAAYAEAFAEHFSRAVQGTLRADRPLSVMLSGGLDSSVIVAEAAAPRSRGRHPLYSFTVGYPGRDVDETAWARAVAAHTGSPWRAVSATSDVYDYVSDARESLHLPPFPAGANSWGLRTAAVAAGGRVLLNGAGGDEWFYGSDWRYADLLRAGQFLRWGREVRADRVLWPVTPLSLIRNSIFPMIPTPWWRTIRHRIGRSTPMGVVNSTFAARIALDERLVDHRLPTKGSYARRDIGREALSPVAAAAKEEFARLGARSGTVDRHPFFNRDLVSFALALPERQRRAAGVTKRIMRHAYQHTLPRAVCERVEYFDYSFLVTAAIRQLLNTGFLATPHVVASGWVDETPLRDLIARAARDPEPGHGATAAVQLWPVMAVEIWLSGVLGSPLLDMSSGRP